MFGYIELENKDRLSQSGRFTSPGLASPSIGTPRNIDKGISTPLRNTMTPKRDRGSMSSTKVGRTNMTPVRTARATPKRIETHLNDDDIAQLMSEDM